ncbi:MAG: Hpt domain-containing protein [Myxococcales bacterium]|nr:Hpt domain-containing protein [Myxococcales bacterium]
MSDHPLLDTAVLEELRDLDPQLLTDTLSLYKEDGARHIAAIAAALESGDDDVRRRNAHSFKGSSGTVGAMRVMAACRAVEAETNDHEAAFAKLRAEFAEACQAIDSFLAS